MTAATETDWRLRAACRGEDPRLFFPEKAAAGQPTDQRPDHYRRPRRICQPCKVKTQCLNQVIGLTDTQDQWGMYGGYTPAERQQERRCRNHLCDHPSHQRRPA